MLPISVETYQKPILPEKQNTEEVVQILYDAISLVEERTYFVFNLKIFVPENLYLKFNSRHIEYLTSFGCSKNSVEQTADNFVFIRPDEEGWQLYPTACLKLLVMHT